MLSLDYSQIAKEFSPLDLIFFRGTDIISSMVKIYSPLSEERFSHVGLIVNSETLPTIKELQVGKWYLLESTISVNKQEKGRLGIQIRELEAVVSSYIKEGGLLAWARVKDNPLLQEKKRKTINQIRKILKILGDRKYDSPSFDPFGWLFCLRDHRDSMIKLILDDSSKNPSFDKEISSAFKQDLLISSAFYKQALLISSAFYKQALLISSAFYKQATCQGIGGWMLSSELIALIYQELNLIPKDKSPEKIKPSDFLQADPDGIPFLVEDPIFLARSLDFEISSSSLSTIEGQKV